MEMAEKLVEKRSKLKGTLFYGKMIKDLMKHLKTTLQSTKS